MMRIRRPRLAFGAAAHNIWSIRKLNQSQAIEQRWRRYIHQPRRRSPGRRQSEPVIAKTIGKEQTQQVHRVFYHASLQKSAGLPRAALKKRRATKPFYEIFPVPIKKRFASHPTLNHKPIRLPRHILTPMRFRGNDTAELASAEYRFLFKTRFQSIFPACGWAKRSVPATVGAVGGARLCLPDR